MHRVCSLMATPYEKAALVLMELMGVGGGVVSLNATLNVIIKPGG